MHLTICSLRIRWSKNHTSRRRENPGHARHPAPQQFRFNQLWKWYEVDDQLISGRRLHRQVGWLFALENAIDIVGRAPVLVRPIRPTGNQTAGGDVVTSIVYRRQLVLRGQPNDQVPTT